MGKKIKEVLDKQISLIKLNEDELKNIKKETNKFINLIKKSLKKQAGVKADVFIGGSLAKNTLIKKEIQDIDIFIRFDKSYDDEKISKIMNNLKNIINFGKKQKIHGSRDYLKFIKKNLVFELVPVLKISNPEQAKNVTDLSYFHVNYIKKLIKKNNKLSDEIKLAKSFCFAQGCYGAESFINGFSGYGLELLVSYYKSFEKMLKNLSREKGKKLIIDPKKYYKNKNQVLFELNEAKLSSPIIFIDPTFKMRNALAALSYETFSKFRKAAKSFLKNPCLSFFKIKQINEKKFNLILKAKTDKQAGDVAGTKLLKFFNYFSLELNKQFEIKKKEFEYNEGKEAKFYFKVNKKEIIISGPPLKMKQAVANFRKAHKKIFTKAGKVYTKNKPVSIKQFLINFKKSKRKVMKEMGIIYLDSL